MALPLELKLAYKFSRAKKDGFVSVITILSILGITLGVATLIIVMSVMNGFRTDLMQRILGINNHVSLYSSVRGIDNYEEEIAKLSKLPQVQHASALIEGHAIISNASIDNMSDGIKIRGISVADLKANKLLENNKFKGSFDGQGIVIGNLLSRALGVYIGDEVTLVTPSSSSTVFGSVPRKKTFKVVGVFDVGMHEYDRYMAYIPLDFAQKMYNFSGRVESIGIMLNDITAAQEFASSLQTKLGSKYYVVDWQKQNASFFEAIKTERNVMFLILTLIIIVASFNIISGMVMLVKDKAKSIAILRTMGMTKASIVRSFIIAGSFNGLFGTIVGVILGLSVALNIQTIREAIEYLSGAELFNAEIYFLSKLPSEVHFDQVGAVAAIAVLVSLLAAIYPAIKAARLEPAEVLKHE